MREQIQREQLHQQQHQPGHQSLEAKLSALSSMSLNNGNKVRGTDGSHAETHRQTDRQTDRQTHSVDKVYKYHMV